MFSMGSTGFTVSMVSRASLDSMVSTVSMVLVVSLAPVVSTLSMASTVSMANEMSPGLMGRLESFKPLDKFGRASGKWHEPWITEWSLQQYHNTTIIL